MEASSLVPVHEQPGQLSAALHAEYRPPVAAARPSSSPLAVFSHSGWARTMSSVMSVPATFSSSPTVSRLPPHASRRSVMSTIDPPADTLQIADRLTDRVHKRRLASWLQSAEPKDRTRLVCGQRHTTEDRTASRLPLTLISSPFGRRNARDSILRGVHLANLSFFFGPFCSSYWSREAVLPLRLDLFDLGLLGLDLTCEPFGLFAEASYLGRKLSPSFV